MSRASRAEQSARELFAVLVVAVLRPVAAAREWRADHPATWRKP